MYRRNLIILDRITKVSDIKQRIPSFISPLNKWRIVEVSTGKSRIVDDIVIQHDTSRDSYMMEAIFGREIPRLSSTGLSRVICKVFLPVGYPDSATPNYSLFVRYTLSQVALISFTRILSTQAMLIAVGMGHSGALPMAAVINWLLKDGIGHIGSLLAGTKINTKFDSDPKRYKFLSVFLGQCANLLGIMSLARPGLFLLLTSLSSGLSRVGTLAVTSSRARIYEDFSLKGNLGDMIRCSQAQSTLGTVIGTIFGVGFAPFIGGDIYSILAVFAPASVATHYVAYKAVSVVELSTFNRQRFEIVMHTFLETGNVPDYHSVAEEEKFILSNKIFKNIRINPPIVSITGMADFMVENLVRNGFHISFESSGIVEVYFRDTATSDQTIEGMFFACIKSRGLSGSQEEFEKFMIAAVASGWRTSLTFIDDIDSRVILSNVEN